MENRIKLIKLNAYYLFGAIIFLTLGNFLQSLNFEIGLIITEYVLVLGYSLLIVKMSKAKFSDYVHFNDVSRMTLLKTVLIVLLSLPVVMLLNLITLYILEVLGRSISYDIPIAKNFASVIFQFFIISISAGICEEVFFRGVILNTYTDYFSYKKAIIISALMFGMFHFNLQNILGPIYLGIVFGYLTLKTQSIVPAILGHMTNNGVAYVISYVGSFITTETEGMIDASFLLDSIMSLAFIAVFSVGIVLYIIKTIPGRDMNLKDRQVEDHKKREFIPLVITIVLYIGYSTYIFF
ncbi:MAG: type II CAAX endopeptidase family protein [Bacillota bacterium]|nr:type II CAAX endopeptidase family protein [Bacillota bacterium]